MRLSPETSNHIIFDISDSSLLAFETNRSGASSATELPFAHAASNTINRFVSKHVLSYYKCLPLPKKPTPLQLHPQ